MPASVTARLDTRRGIDVIYVAASTHDARYTRICVASIRHFYPDVPIKLLVGGRLQRGLASELKRHWNVTTADVPSGEYGWGFVKLEALFGRPGERFLMLDSDTAIVGDVLSAVADSLADFIVDDEQPPDSEIRQLYYDWIKLAEIDAVATRPAFVFNTGQWFGTAGLLDRGDFAALVDWSALPPRLRHSPYFMPGDQGVLNYVLNRKAAAGSAVVERRNIMRWPGHGMHEISAVKIASRGAPPVIVHWAGLKKLRLSAMNGTDVLSWFEGMYYAKIPLGGSLRRIRSFRYFFAVILSGLVLRVRLRHNRLRARSSTTVARHAKPIA